MTQTSTRELPPRDAAERELAELARAYERYRHAMLQARSSCDLTDEAADAVLRARVELTRALTATGWQPPAGVAEQIRRDEALTETCEDFEEVLAASGL